MSTTKKSYLEKFTGEGGLPEVLKAAGFDLEHVTGSQREVVEKFGSAVLEKVSTNQYDLKPDDELARRMLPRVVATLAGLGEDPKLADVLVGEEADETDEELTELLAEAARLRITEVWDYDLDRASDLRSLGLGVDGTVEAAKDKLRMLIAQEEEIQSGIPDDDKYQNEDDDHDDFEDDEDHDNEDTEDEYEDNDSDKDAADPYTGRKVEF